MTRVPAAPLIATPVALLRPLQLLDSAPLFEALSGDDVARFIHAPPSTVAAFRRYVAWARREGRGGRHLTVGVVPHGTRWPVGIFQIRRHGPTWDTAEWGFAFATTCWGTGLFIQTAPLVVDYAFGTLGVRRLEARAMTGNGRGNGALAKVGAVCEAVLRESCERRDQRFDEHLWAITARTWRMPPTSGACRLSPRLQLSPGGAK